MIRYKLPGIFEHDEFTIINGKLNTKFNNSYNYTFYGGIDCKWTFGRNGAPIYSIEQIYDILKKYYSINIVMSNPIITRQQLSDNFSNKILEVVSYLNASVIVSSNLLLSYIRKYYNNINVVGSMITSALVPRRKRSYDWYKSLLDIYDEVVIHCDDNFRLKMLHKLDTSRIELVINEPCVLNCPYRVKRYFDIYNRHDNIRCLQSNKLDKKLCNIPLNKLYKYTKLGINKFKLAGRGRTLNKLLPDLISYKIYNP